MPELDAILAAIEVLESRLHTPLKIAEAAEAASYSLFHFCRLFSRYTRHTPYEYLMRRRLTQAALDLAAGGRWVVDVAADYQFASAEGFSRAFRRMFTTPAGQVRQGHPLDPRQALPPFTRPYLEHLQRLRPVPQRERLAGQDLAGLMSLAFPPERALPDLWRLLAGEAQARLVNFGPLAGYALLLYPHPYLSPEAFCFCGLPGPALTERPPTLASYALPEQEVACFEHPGSLDMLPNTLAYIYHTWLPHSPAPRLPERVILRFPALWPGEFCADCPVQILLPC